MKKLFIGLIGILISIFANGQTFTNSTAVAIPDPPPPNSGVYSDIIVSGIPPTAILTDVTINITHTWDSDLDIYIVDPLNNEHLLSSANGGSGDNYIGTHFTMTAGTSITLGAAPFTGYYIPQSSLPGNVNPNGTWRLHVTDYANGDAGNIVNWSITFSAPPCPTVGFHADGYSVNSIPPVVNCNAVDTFLYANDSSIANGPIYPTLYFQFNTHANGTQNGISIFEDGNLIYTDPILDINTELTVYAIGAFMSPTSLYTIQVCNTGGAAAMEWVVYDGNGFTHGTGTTPAGCTTYGPWSPQGIASWSVSPATSGFASTDWGAAVFSPSIAGPGTYQITYTWNNQGTGAYLCTGSQSQNITVVNPWNAAWSSPGTVCASNGSFNLNSYITGNTGGTWSGSGVSGTTFNPAGLSGNINVTYTVGSGGTCQSSETHVITVTPLATADAGNATSICAGSTHTISGAGYGGSASSVLWSTSGDGFFINSNTTTPTYTPGTADVSSGSVTLTITASGSCAAATDNMILTITPLDNASFNYTSGTFCQSGTNPTPTITMPGGSFTFSPAGLSINASTGNINLLASVANITYTVTYTTIGACPNTSNATILISSGFDASFSYSGPYCQSGVDPSPTFTTGSAGTFSSVPPGLVFINTGTGVINLAATAPNTYTVTNTIPASGGCASASSFSDVTINQSPIVSAGNDINICENTSYSLTGSMAGSATSITWTSSGDGLFSNNSSINSSYTPGTADLINGAVTLTITSDDPIGPCLPASDNILITIFNAPVVNAGVDATICSNENYISNGTMSGSTSSVSWSSSGAGSFDDVTSLTATYTPGPGDIISGTVTLTLTSNDPAGPCNAVSDFLVLTFSPLPTVNAGNDISVCAGIIANVSGIIGGGATSANWSSSGNGSFANTSDLATTYTPSPADISLGSVTLTLTTNDPAGSCIAVSDQLILTINPSPILDSILTGDVTTCATPDGTIDIYALGGTGGLQYSIDGGNIFSSNTSYTGLNVGIYDIVVLDGNLCEVTGQGTISTASNIGPVILSVDITHVTCYGDNSGAFTIHAQDAILFSVNGGSLVSDSVFTGLSAGIYNIVVQDAGSCQDITQITVNQNSELQIDSLITNAGCGTIGSATIFVTGGLSPFNYDWSNDTANHTNFATNLTAGNYTVTVYDFAGCQGTINVIVGSSGGAGNGIISDTSNVSCFGLSDGYATVAMTNGVSPYTYQWSNNPLNNTATANNLAAGIYFVTINDNSSCSVVLTININQPAILQIDSIVTNAGCGTLGSATIIVTGGTSPYTFNWSNSLTNHSDTSTNLSAGNYTITVLDFAGCQGTIIVTVGSVSGTGNGIISDTSNVSCFGLSDGSATVAMTNGVSPYTYLWSNNNNTATANNLPIGTYTVTINDNSVCTVILTVNISQPAVLEGTVITNGNTCYGLQNGTALASAIGGTSPYTYHWSNNQNSAGATGLAQGNYSVTITDNNNCIDSVINVGITESSVIVIGAVSVNPSCSNSNDGIIRVHVTGGTSPYFYSWSDLQTDSIADNLFAGTYSLTVIDNYGCSDTISYLLVQPQGMIADYTAKPTSCYDNIDGEINLTVFSGKAPYRFIWSNTKTTEDITGLEGATYTVTITDSINCSITFQAIVPKGQKECFEIPSAFTPNADGSNDKWEFKNMGLYPDISVEVYNRWGALMFKSDKYVQEPWDGTYNGNDVPAGTYVYIIRQSTSKEPFNGTVTVIR